MTSTRTSLKAARFSESVIREMTRLAAKHNAINLAQGFPNFPAPDFLKEAAVKAIRNDINQYAITWGSANLRAAVAEKYRRTYDWPVDPETDLTVCCGSTECMISSILATVDPGQNVLIFEPFYENYGPDGILSGATPCYVTLHMPHWSIDFDELKNVFNNNTKAIIINTPNNPTGKVFSKEELETIAELCQKWDVYAITDEIYEHITYDGKEHISIASIADMADRTITINSLSKTYSVTGWRVGWAIASKNLTERIRKVHDFLTVGAPTPLQHAGVVALNLPDSYYKKLRGDYFKKRNFLFDLLRNSGFNPFLPLGSYYMMADFQNLKEKLDAQNDLDFSRKLIEKTGVATVPGFSFYSRSKKGENLIRFTFCKKWETLHTVEKIFNSRLNK